MALLLVQKQQIENKLKEIQIIINQVYILWILKKKIIRKYQIIIILKFNNKIHNI